MIDSTNPRILADNIRGLSDKQIVGAAKILALQGDIEALGSYSATEINTGMKYGDSVIYRKVFEINEPTVGELTSIAHGIANMGLVLDCHGVAQVATGFSGKNVPYSSNILLTFTGTNIEYNITSGQAAIKKLIIVFEYTKAASLSLTSPAPDDTRSIEPGTREDEPIIDEPIEEPVVEVKKTTRKKTTTTE